MGTIAKLRRVFLGVVFLVGVMQIPLVHYLSTEIPTSKDKPFQHLKSNTGKLNIVGFWHIGKSFQGSTESRDVFVMKQAKEILGTYLFKERSKTTQYDLKLNYVTRETLSNETKSFLQKNDIEELVPTVLDMDGTTEYFEFPSLMELYSFCKKPENHDKIVFYIHTKTVDILRFIFQDFLFGKRCLSCMKSNRYKACGPHYTDTSKFLWSHFAGNFWMTRCSYISILNPPWFNKVLEEEANIKDIKEPWNFHPPYGRYLAEYWMMNDYGERDGHLPYGRSSSIIKKEEVCSNGLTRQADAVSELSNIFGSSEL